MFTNNLFKRWTYKFFAPYRLQRETYEAFKRLLEHDRECHEQMADLQDLFFKKDPAEWTKVTAVYDQLTEAVGAMANELTIVSSRDASDLVTYYKKFNSYIRFLLQTESNLTGPPYSICLNEPRLKLQLIGNKAKNLAEVHQKTDCSIPPGFVVTTNSWNALIEYNDLRSKINSHLISLDPADKRTFLKTSQNLISLIMGASIPPEVDKAFLKSLNDLVTGLGTKDQTRFAVRSSAVNEDGQNSFAGQYLSLLDVATEDVQHSYLQILASKYTPSALLYRITAGISDAEAPMAVLVLKMVAAKAAGVIYTGDPAGRENDTIFVRSVAGGGEKLVSGKARPHLTRFNKNDINLASEPGPDCPINANECRKLAKMALDLEDFFGKPQDIEWAVGGGDPIILQSRPLRTVSVAPVTEQQDNCCVPDLPLLYHGGVTAAGGRGTGPAWLISADQGLDDLPDDAILIVDSIPASLILSLPKCSGVVSILGSVASHFSTICRELEVPLIVEATQIKEKVSHGEMITIDADNQNIYLGKDESCLSLPNSSPPPKQLPYFHRLQTILDFITPLNMLDPESDLFVPESCRSFHDIVRFAHEKGIQAMFAIGDSGSRKGHRKQLKTTLPFDLYLINIDESEQSNQSTDDTIAMDQISSIPFRALWQGLTHPSIEWGDHVYYNWKEYDNIAMTDGFAFKNKTESASYAVCSLDYLNLNIRFGYHFTVVDVLCTENSEQNYCSIRFAGGGGTVEGRYFRLHYLEEILRKLGFLVTSKTDLLDGRLEGLATDLMIRRLVTLGRMLGTSKQMDMVLKNEESVASHLDLFFQIDDTPSHQETIL